MRTISLVRRLSLAVVAVTCALTFAQSVSAQAMHGSGGHVGGIGGFNRGGPFHSDGFEGFGGSRFAAHEDFHHRGGFLYVYPDDGAYDDSQSWYCEEPAGYYPDVQQCSTGWQLIP